MRKFLIGLAVTVMGATLAATPVMAECTDYQLQNGCVNTAILGSSGCSCGEDTSGKTADDESYDKELAQSNSENGMMQIFELVINVMSVGVGILGVIGITVVGIQYLTAGGSEEKTRKAKRRMFEIVIGLIAYALSYAFLKWLLPEF